METALKPTTYQELCDTLVENLILRSEEGEQVVAATRNPENKLYPYAANLLAHVAMLVNDELEMRSWNFDFTVAVATWRCAVELA